MLTAHFPPFDTVDQESRFEFTAMVRERQYLDQLVKQLNERRAHLDYKIDRARSEQEGQQTLDV